MLTEVAHDVWVATSRRDLTTTTLVVSDGAVLLIDPAWEPDELTALAEEILQRGWTITAGIATHAHEDHLLWHPLFGSAVRYGSPMTVTLAAAHRLDLVAALGPAWPLDLAALVGDVTPFPAAGVPFPEQTELVVHDAHLPGHTAVWLPGRGVLVAGDMLSDVELPLPFDPDDIDAYVDGMNVLAPYAAAAAVLIPGHGHPTTDPAARLEADRAYLEAVSRGDHVDDARLGNPGMAEVDERIRTLARRSR